MRFANQQLTSFVAHWKPATTLSFISLRYCTPLVQSISKFGPDPSGPNAQIFLASVTSYSYFSAKYLALTLKSSLGLTSPQFTIQENNTSICVNIGTIYFKSQFLERYLFPLILHRWSNRTNHWSSSVERIAKYLLTRSDFQEITFGFVFLTFSNLLNLLSRTTARNFPDLKSGQKILVSEGVNLTIFLQ